MASLPHFERYLLSRTTEVHRPAGDNAVAHRVNKSVVRVRNRLRFAVREPQIFIDWREVKAADHAMHLREKRFVEAEHRRLMQIRILNPIDLCHDHLDQFKRFRNDAAGPVRIPFTCALACSKVAQSRLLSWTNFCLALSLNCPMFFDEPLVMFVSKYNGNFNPVFAKSRSRNSLMFSQMPPVLM
jgi:hypothetical protein